MYGDTNPSTRFGQTELMHPWKYYFKESQKLYSRMAFLQSKPSQEIRGTVEQVLQK